jgi:hypothetical protein
MTLETIIRPFQTNDVAPPKPYFNVGQIGVPNVKLAIGRSGVGKTLNGHFSLTQTFYCTKYVNEAKTPLSA